MATPNHTDISYPSLQSNASRLRSLLRETLRTHGSVDVTKIGISVSGDKVLLWGSVATPTEREVAGEVAAKLVGANHVDNRLRVFRH